MISRSAFVTVCFVLLVAGSLPAGAYTAASNSGSAASTSPTGIDDPYKKECLGLPTHLENITMHVYEQEATDLRTESTTVVSGGNGTTPEEDMIAVTAEAIHSPDTCFKRPWKANETMVIELTDVEFTNTSLRGPWSRVTFGHGEATKMTILLSGEQYLKTLKQSPRGRLIFDSMKSYFELSANVTLESATMSTDASTAKSDTSPTNTTERNESVKNETSPDNPAENETVPESGSENTTDAIDERGTNTTDSTNDSSQNSTGAIESVTSPALEATDSDTDPSGTETVPRFPAIATGTLPAAAVGRRADTATESTATPGTRDL